MAQNNQPLVLRSKLLPNNNAAEFVETQTDKVFGPEFSRPNGTEFAPDVDMFVDQGVVSSIRFERYSQASQAKRKEFEALLVDFAKLMDDQQLEKRFQVKSKSLQDYKIQDVLEIAEKVQRKYGSASKVREHTAVFRKCFAAVGRNPGAMNNLLNFIPDDSYGSIIFGGFTLILTAIERAETLRETAYAALAEIPRKLELISSLTDCLRKSVGLYQAGDAVLIALFGALTQIINELTKSKGKKTFSLLIKGKSYGASLDAALESLETKLAAFKDEVTLCNSQRLGEMAQSQFRIESKLDNYLCQVTAEKTSIAALQLASTKSIEEGDTNAQRQSILEDKDKLITFLNHLYSLCASDPNLDPYTGRYIPPSKDLKPSKSENERFAKEWLSALPLQFLNLAAQDLDDALKSSTALNMEDQGKVQHIMTNANLFGWLKAQKSSVLLIQGAVPPDHLSNPLSFSSAFLTQTLQRVYEAPVLYYHCRYRSRESSEEDMSGPLALLSTLNAQLIDYILKTHGDVVDLDFLQRNQLSKASRKSKRHSLREVRGLFKQLIGCLPDSDVVFIIIDAMSWLPGDENVANKVLSDILKLAARSETRRIKLLLTDILSRTVLEGYDYVEVLVPSRVDSSGQSLNLHFLREETQNSLSADS